MNEIKRIDPKDLLKKISGHESKKKYAGKYRGFVEGNMSVAIPNDDGNIGSDEFINFGEITRDRKLGYMFGQPFSIKHSDNKKAQELISEVMAHNDFSHLSTETGRELMDVGYTYWLVYLDEKKRMKIKVRPMEEIILVKSDDLTDETYAGIRHFVKYNRIKEEEGLYVEVYYRDWTYFYLEDKRGELILDPDRKPQVNPFGYVPIVEFINNNGHSDHKSIFGLTILYNKIFNHGSDEILEIGNSFFKFINGNFDEETMDKFKQTQALIKKRILILDEGDDGKTPDAQIMNKNSDNSTFENFLNYLRKRIFELASVPDYESMSDSSADTSAKAMIQRQRPMEDYCKIKEDNLRTALRYFTRIFIKYTELMTGSITELKEYEIRFNRNSVDNSLYIETIADLLLLKSHNLLSDEDVLALLPFITDPKNTLARRDAAAEKAYGLNYTNYEEE